MGWCFAGRFNLRGSSPGSTGIRRTASLDTIYLKGQWPRDGTNWFSDVLQKDKATQVGLIFIDMLIFTSIRYISWKLSINLPMIFKQKINLILTSKYNYFNFSTNKNLFKNIELDSISKCIKKKKII